MNSEFTTSQVNALGERLRKGEPVAADLERLDSYRRSFDDVYKAVVRTLRDLGLEPSGRIKTTISIVEKLKRQSFRLSRLQDIAGCRIVVENITEQDHIIGLISKALPNAKVIDRRQRHSHGYRAVHIVVEETEGSSRYKYVQNFNTCGQSGRKLWPTGTARHLSTVPVLLRFRRA